MYTIKDMLSLEQIKDISLKAGCKGVYREITTVTIMDIPEIIEWVHGGELLIAGVLFEQCFNKDMVDALMAKKVAGIATKAKFTLSIGTGVFSYCDKVGFPVVLIPASYNWEQIIRPILKAIIQKPYTIIEENQKLHFMLIHAIINGVSLSEICHKFYMATQISHAIFDSDLHMLASSDDNYWQPCSKKINTDMLMPSEVNMQHIDNTQVQTYCYHIHLFNDSHRKLFFYPILLDHVKYGYIVIILDNNTQEIPPNEAMKIQQLGLIIALHIVKLRGISEATRRFNSLLLDQLLLDDTITTKRAEELLVPTGKKLYSQYYVVHFIYKNLDSVDSFVRYSNRISRFHEMLEKQIKNSAHIIIFEKNNAQILLIPYPDESIEILLTQLKMLFISATQFAHIYIGISEPTSLNFIKKAFIQSERVARFLMSINSQAIYYRYSDLGILRFFIEKEGKLADTFIRELYDAIIKPLLNYDKEHNTQLLKTLTIYINSDCSKTKTEKKLFIHKNTLISRFNTINKLLNCNLNSSEDFFNIQLALKIHQALLMTDLSLS